MANPKKRKVTKFTLSEISVVGTPAQEPALIALSKSAAEELRKNQPEDTAVSEALQKQLDDLQKKFDDQTAVVTTQKTHLDRLTAEAAMSVDVRKYYGDLAEAERTSFLVKSATVQEAEVQNAALANAVIYKDASGTEYHKNDDPRLVAMAKQADRNAELLKRMETQNQDLGLAKQAEEFKHLPGDEATHKATLKAINGIEDEEVRKASLASLKAHDKNLSKFFTATGISTTGEVVPEDTNGFAKSGSTKLDALVKSHMEANPGMLVESAFDAVLQTPDGERAYAELEFAS